MSLSLVQYSDVKFQITNFKGVYTIFPFILIKLYVRHQNESFSSLMKVILNRGPGFDPIVGSRAVPETHYPPPRPPNSNYSY